MNNLITINFADPIREEYNQAIDKMAALNTIAFKYFKGDRIEAHNYLSDNYIDSVEKDLPNQLMINQSNNQYYQPELI